MIKFAKQGIIPQFILFLLTAIACIFGILYGNEQPLLPLPSNNSFIAQAFSAFFEKYKILNIIVIFLMLIAIAFAFFTAEKYKTNKHQNGFFRSFILGIMLFGIANMLNFNILFILLLTVSAFGKILQKQEESNYIFRTTLLISVASFFDFQLIWLQVAVVLFFLIYRTHHFRDILLAFGGIVFPYLWFYIGLYYLSDISFVQILSEMKLLNFNANVLVLCLLPAVYVISNILYKMKGNWGAELLVSLLIAMAVAVNVVGNIA